MTEQASRTGGQTGGQVAGLCWGSMPGATLFELAGAAAAAGLGWFSPLPSQVLDELAAGTGPAAIRARLGGLGVRVSVIDPLIRPVPGTPPPEAVEERMRALFEPDQEDAWRAAEATGAGTINFTHFLGGGVEREALFDGLRALAKGNRARGFASTIEFVPGTGIPDLPTAAALTAGQADFTILLDTWHLARSGGTIADIAALPPGAIGAVQVNDWSPPEPGAPYVPMAGRLVPGEGSLPLAAILRAVEDNSPGQIVGIEVFNADLAGPDRNATARRLAAATLPLLAGANEGATSA